MRTILLILWVTATCCTFSLSAQTQNSSQAGVPVQMIVTAGHYYGREPALLTREDLTVTQETESVPVTKLIPLKGDRAALELFVLIDNCSNCEASSQFSELHRFIAAQLATTRIGVAYIQEGRLVIGQELSADRRQVIKALSPPEGSEPSDPFPALTELLARWKPDSSRHAILMISNGVVPKITDVEEHPSAEAAIALAQRTRVPVYVIYHPSANWLTNSAAAYSGQVQLAHVAIETGGEAYFQGLGPLPTLTPFLSDMSEHLANQYLLEFRAVPSESGALEHVIVQTESTDFDLMVPDRVWIPGRTDH